MTISTKILGIVFENPYLLASAPPTANIESLDKAFALGWGGAVLKTIVPDDLEMQDVTPRFAVWKNHDKVLGFQNIELLSHRSLDYWIQGIYHLKNKYPTKVIIASIMAPVVETEWQKLVVKLQETPIDAFELNFSCPHGMPEKGIGMAIGTDATISAKITQWVKKVSKVPVFVKLSPNVTDIASIAKTVVDAGADGISAINTVQCIMGVDLDTLTPQPNVGGFSAFGGYSGLAIKPIGLKCLAQIKKAVDVPVLGMGGICSWKDAAEYIAMGADAVQVCTEVMVNGYQIINGLTTGLNDYLDTKKQSLASIKGVAVAKMTTHQSLDKKTRLCAQIDGSTCVKCKKCLTICAESGYGAIIEKNGNIEVNKHLCDGCSLCTHICPKQAISMKANSI